MAYHAAINTAGPVLRAIANLPDVPSGEKKRYMRAVLANTFTARNLVYSPAASVATQSISGKIGDAFRPKRKADPIGDSVREFQSIGRQRLK
jgi:hypothetical protein